MSFHGSPPSLGAKVILCLMQKPFALCTDNLAFPVQMSSGDQQNIFASLQGCVAWPATQSLASVCFSSALTQQVCPCAGLICYACFLP